MSKLKVVSLFSGVAGLDKYLHKSKNFEVVAFCEEDINCIDVLRYHYPDIPNLGTLGKFKPSVVPNHDVLTFGFPCQPYSEAGLRQGLDDFRGQLIYHVFDVIKEKKPKYFIAENVKGILSHNGGETFLHLLECFSTLGYAVDFEVLNARDFGVLQRRERVIIIGKRLDVCSSIEIDMFKEKWKFINGTNNKYAISNKGRVKSNIGKPKILKPSLNTEGYPQVVLRIGGESKTRRVHRLVASKFVGNKKRLPFVNHSNGDRSNPCFLNLEWCNRSMNEKHKHNQLGNKPRGASFHKPSGKWRSTITLDGRTITIGYYATKEEAQEKFREKYIEVHHEEPWKTDSIREVENTSTTKSKNKYVLFGYGIRRYKQYTKLGRHIREKRRREVLHKTRKREEDASEKRSYDENTQEEINIVTKRNNIIRRHDSINCIDKNYHRGIDNHGQRAMIAYSKSTRPGHIDHRIRINECANTFNKGDGCSSQSSATYIVEHDLRIRKLTPRECEKLMSWEEDYTLYGKKLDGELVKMSNTKRYAMCGNGVASVIIKPIRDLIIKNENRYRRAKKKKR